MCAGGVKLTIPTPGRALKGRAERMVVPAVHVVGGAPLEPPFPPSMDRALFGMGCFWGAERVFWQAPGVFTTAVGYAGGSTPNPTYREVCTGMTGHAEVVLIVFDPARTSFAEMLRLFWENHDPTQGMRQGADVGTQYRSVLYGYSVEQLELARQSRDLYQARLASAGFGPITTEIREAPEFYYAEEYHQQYLARNPGGFCGHGGTGVACSTGALARTSA